MSRSVITIGNFDGVHAGHRAILGESRRLAREAGAEVVAITFDPHPAAILRPGAEPPRLLSIEDRAKALEGAGADRVEVLPPTPALLSLSAEIFLGQLCERWRPVAIVEGPDFRFGKGRAGDAGTLEAFGRSMGFRTAVMPRLRLALSDRLLAPVSSSLVRWLLFNGRVADAAICMTRPFALRGVVAKGEKRGRTLGIPTANLEGDALAGLTVPGEGVYAGVAQLVSGEAYAAAISIGVKPTFGNASRLIEAHLLGFSGDLYGQPLTIRFTRWLRDQQRFPNVESLRSQLGRDVAAVRWLHDGGLLEAMTWNRDCA